MINLFETNYLILAIVIIASYFIGSISFGILITKVLKLGNLRSLGSGNIGATNVLRTGNKVAAALTLVLDGGKGYLAIFGTNYFFEDLYFQYTSIAVFLGHVFPIYHGLKGGKGVATFVGVILAFDWLIGLMTCIIWLGIAFISKKSSLASLGCSLGTTIIFALNNAYNTSLSVLILTLLIWWLHKENIKRLISNSEPSISFMKK